MKKTMLLLIVLLISETHIYNGSKLQAVTNTNVVKEKVKEKKILVTVTMYNASVGQCDKTPLITACGRKINPKKASEHKWIAVSRDLLKVLKYGDKVRLSNAGKKNGIYTITDCMSKKWKNKIDILETENTPIYKLTNVILTKV